MDLDKESLRNAAIGFAAVSEVVVYTVGGYLAGRFLDRSVGFQGPWLATVLTAAGFVGGFYRLYSVLKRFTKN